MATVKGGDVVLPGYNPGSGTPAPQSAPQIILPAPTVDPNVIAQITYGHPIPLFIGGYARIGAENIIFGPFPSWSWANSFGMPCPIGTHLVPQGSRTLYKIFFDSKEVWSLTGGFTGASFTFRFYPGRFDQAFDPLETAFFPGTEVAYRPQMVVFFENVPLFPIPYVSIEVGEGSTTEINIGDAIETFGRSIYVGYSEEDFETSGITDTAGALLSGQMPAIRELMPTLTQFYRTWDVTISDKLRMIDRGPVTAPDRVLYPDDLLRGPEPLRFDRTKTDAVPRTKKLITIDPDYDYVLVPSQHQRTLAVATSTTADEETTTLPLVMTAFIREPLVLYAHYAEEYERLNCSFTVGARNIDLAPGDRVSFSGFDTGNPDDIWKIVEANTKTNFTKQCTGHLILRTATPEPPNIYRLVAILVTQNVTVTWTIRFTTPKVFITEEEINTAEANSTLIQAPVFGDTIDTPTDTYSYNHGPVLVGGTTYSIEGDALSTTAPSVYIDYHGYTDVGTFNWNTTIPGFPVAEFTGPHLKCDYNGQTITSIPTPSVKGRAIASDANGTVFACLNPPNVGDPIGFTKYDADGNILWNVDVGPATYKVILGVDVTIKMFYLYSGGFINSYDMDGNLISGSQVNLPSYPFSVQDVSRNGKFYGFRASADFDFFGDIQCYAEDAITVLWTIPGEASATGYEFLHLTAYGEDYIIVPVWKAFNEGPGGNFGNHFQLRVYNAHDGTLVSSDDLPDDTFDNDNVTLPGPIHIDTANRPSYDGPDMYVARSNYWP